MRKEEIFCDTCRKDITDCPEGSPLKVEISAGFVFTAQEGEFCSWRCAEVWWQEKRESSANWTVFNPEGKGQC